MAGETDTFEATCFNNRCLCVRSVDHVVAVLIVVRERRIEVMAVAVEDAV